MGYIVPGGDFSAPPALVPLHTSLDADIDLAHDVQVLGDRSGENLWSLKPTGVVTQVDLMTKEGTALASFDLAGSYAMTGLLEDDLMVAGGEGREELLLRPDGTVGTVVSCPDIAESALNVVFVHGNRTACLSEDGRYLALHDVATRQTELFTAFGSGTWTWTELPYIPSANTTGADTDQLLLSYQEPDPVTGYRITKAIYAADLSDQTLRHLHDLDQLRFLRPLGLVGNFLIASTGIVGQGESIVSVDIQSGERKTVVTLPVEYYIYDISYG